MGKVEGKKGGRKSGDDWGPWQRRGQKGKGGWSWRELRGRDPFHVSVNVTSRDKFHTIYLPAYMCSCTSPLREGILCFHSVPKDQTSHRPWWQLHLPAETSCLPKFHYQFWNLKKKKASLQKATVHNVSSYTRFLHFVLHLWFLILLSLYIIRQ